MSSPACVGDLFECAVRRGACTGGWAGRRAGRRRFHPSRRCRCRPRRCRCCRRYRCRRRSPAATASKGCRAPVGCGMQWTRPGFHPSNRRTSLRRASPVSHREDGIWRVCRHPTPCANEPRGTVACPPRTRGLYANAVVRQRVKSQIAQRVRRPQPLSQTAFEILCSGVEHGFGNFAVNCCEPGRQGERSRKIRRKRQRMRLAQPLQQRLYLCRFLFTENIHRSPRRYICVTIRRDPACGVPPETACRRLSALRAGGKRESRQPGASEKVAAAPLGKPIH